MFLKEQFNIFPNIFLRMMYVQRLFSPVYKEECFSLLNLNLHACYLKAGFVMSDQVWKSIPVLIFNLHKCDVGNLKLPLHKYVNQSFFI